MRNKNYVLYQSSRLENDFTLASNCVGRKREKGHRNIGKC